MRRNSFMKKVLVAGLSVILLLGLSACGGKEKEVLSQTESVEADSLMESESRVEPLDTQKNTQATETEAVTETETVTEAESESEEKGNSETANNKNEAQPNPGNNQSSSSNANNNSYVGMSAADIQKMDGIIAGVTGSGMNKAEKIRAIHDWMVKNIYYDTSYRQHSASDTLNNGLAVCSGYADLFAAFMNRMNVNNQVVYGIATNGLGQTEGHAWNAVQLDDGYWYFVDVTWDDPLINNSSDDKTGKNLRYDYFLTTYDEIKKDHTENYGTLTVSPKATSLAVRDQFKKPWEMEAMLMNFTHDDSKALHIANVQDVKKTVDSLTESDICYHFVFRSNEMTAEEMDTALREALKSKSGYLCWIQGKYYTDYYDCYYESFWMISYETIKAKIQKDFSNSYWPNSLEEAKAYIENKPSGELTLLFEKSKFDMDEVHSVLYAAVKDKYGADAWNSVSGYIGSFYYQGDSENAFEYGCYTFKMN